MVVVSIHLGSWCAPSELWHMLRAIQFDARKKKKDLLSQYEFRKAIALAWIDPKHYWPEKWNTSEALSVDSSNSRKRKSSSVTDEQRQTKSSFAEKMEIYNKSKVVTDASLHPPSGSLCCRLVLNAGHWPNHKIGHKRAKCALHHWAAQLEQRRHVYRCNVYKVHLCIECFQTFHTVPNIAVK